MALDLIFIFSRLCELAPASRLQPFIIQAKQALQQQHLASLAGPGILCAIWISLNLPAESRVKPVATLQLDDDVDVARPITMGRTMGAAV